MKIIKKLINYCILGFKIILSSQIFYMIISIISLVLLSIVVYRAVNLRNKVNDIENSIVEKV